MISIVLGLRWAACSLQLRCDTLIHSMFVLSFLYGEQTIRNGCQFLPYNFLVWSALGILNRIYFLLPYKQKFGFTNVKNLIKSLKPLQNLSKQLLLMHLKMISFLKTIGTFSAKMDALQKVELRK